MPNKETERIVNISELEEMIQSARLKVISVCKIAEADGNDVLVSLLQEIQNDLTECESFNFVLERRTIRE